MGIVLRDKLARFLHAKDGTHAISARDAEVDRLKKGIREIEKILSPWVIGHIEEVRKAKNKCDELLKGGA